MRNDEYYQSIAKIVEQWQCQNVFAIRAASNAISYVQTLKNIECSMSGFKSMQEQIRMLADSIRPIESMAAKSIREANLRMSTVLDSLRPYDQLAKQLQEDQKRWAASLKASLSTVSQVADVSAALQKEFSFISRSSVFTQQAITRLNLDAIGQAARAVQAVRDTLKQSLLDMSISYEHLWKGFQLKPRVLFDMPSVVIEEPSLEIYTATHLAELSTIEEEIPPQEEAFSKEVEIRVESIQEILCSVGEDLVSLHRGATDAITSKNVDKVRHVATSLRELFTHVLHRLAPDEAFFKWNTNDSNVHNGRPTRKGRLLYICRGINHGPFSNFLEKDVYAALAFLDLFQEGTHAVKPPYDNKQLKAMLIRMECLLNFIINASQK